MSISGGSATITRDMIIGSTAQNTLTINSTPTLNNGLNVSSGSVSFPSKSIDASCIVNLPLGIQLTNANTWTKLQTFNDGILTNGETNSGSLTVSGDATLGTSSANSLTINSSPIINSTPIFNKGLTVSTGPVYFPNQSIPSSVITGLISLSGNNTWSGRQSFIDGAFVFGSTTGIYSEITYIGSPGSYNKNLIVNTNATFNGGLSVPNNALPIVAISGLSTKLTSLESSIASPLNANTWTKLQTFNGGIVTNGETNSGSLTVSGDTTLGTSSANSLTINATPVISSTPIFN